MNVIVKLLLIVFVIGAFLALAFYAFNKSSSPEIVSNSMRGTINQLKDGSVEVVGRLATSPGDVARINSKIDYTDIDKTIEFSITPQTIFKKEIIITDKSVKPPTSKITKVSGSVSDLKNGLLIQIKSNDNLFKARKPIATEIYYVTAQLAE